MSVDPVTVLIFELTVEMQERTLFRYNSLVRVVLTFPKMQSLLCFIMVGTCVVYNLTCPLLVVHFSRRSNLYFIIKSKKKKLNTNIFVKFFLSEALCIAVYRS